MSSICNRLSPLIRRYNHGSLRNKIDNRVIFKYRFGLRRLSTDSGQSDDPKDGSSMEKTKLEKAARKITDKVGGQEGKQMKESLMKMVSLQSEESKTPGTDVMKNISNILKDIPIEVSKKMTTGMNSSRGKTFPDNTLNEKPRFWKERPPRLDSRQRRFDDDKPQPRDGQFDDRRRDGQYDDRQRESRHGGRGFMNDRNQNRVNLSQAAPLNLFTTKPSDGDYHSLKVWGRIREQEMDLAFRQPPRNAFEEMIQLTREGKLWSFPIDNEAGLEEEAKVPFYEHTHLDHLLEDLPPSEPVREFMELITIGISNNPFITVERKNAIIRWYVDYFKEKEPILRECGALG